MKAAGFFLFSEMHERRDGTNVRCVLGTVSLFTEGLCIAQATRTGSPQGLAWDSMSKRKIDW